MQLIDGIGEPALLKVFLDYKVNGAENFLRTVSYEREFCLLWNL